MGAWIFMRTAAEGSRANQARVLGYAGRATRTGMAKRSAPIGGASVATPPTIARAADPQAQGFELGIDGAHALSCTPGDPDFSEESR